ncbi:MAG: hypothetical protein JXX14_00410 [Deltaproteobacteria bacterium]|nr:hypothetical protein [Deltaproteobacteria bacterium]
MTQAIFRCPDCKATIHIPETGLRMTCTYCGYEQPVPDAQKRRAQMAKEAQAHELAQQKAEKQQRDAAAARASQRKKMGWTVLSFPFRLALILVPLAIPVAIVAFVFLQQGAGDALLDDATRNQFEAAAVQAKDAGYQPVGPVLEDRVIFNPVYATHQSVDASQCSL